MIRSLGSKLTAIELEQVTYSLLIILRLHTLWIVHLQLSMYYHVRYDHDFHPMGHILLIKREKTTKKVISEEIYG